MPAAHIIICGSVSVNDATHDANPFNFINPAVRRAIALKKSVTMLFYPAGYERRVEKQKKEHAVVTNPEKNINYFTAIMSQKSREHQFNLIKIKSKDELTSTLMKFSDIATIDYFGHSNKLAIFLEYASIDPETSKDYWQASDGINIKPTQFAKGAVFASYGCHQGNPAGLCQKLSEQWQIDTIGSWGKTDYEITGPFGGPTYPTSDKGYIKFPAPLLDKEGNIIRPLPKVQYLKYSPHQPPS